MMSYCLENKADGEQEKVRRRGVEGCYGQIILSI
jgi:hypothetical protein